jgi:HTH-type transcriptional regulator / antitoxin HipB
MQLRSAREIGLLIRDRRRQSGLTQAGLAERLGTSRLWVLQVERGKGTVQLGMVLRALAELGVSLHVMPPTRARRRPTIDIDRIVADSVDERRR